MPHQRRPWLITLTAALVQLGPVTEARAVPRVPADPGLVLERVPRTGDPRIAELARRLAANPGDLATAAELAGLYAALARTSQDSRYAGYAQAALAPWWHEAEPPPRVLILRGLLRQHRHDFEGALADLDRAAAVTPSNPQVWLVRAAVLQVLGRPKEALASCRRLRGLARPLVSTVCEAGAAARMGQAAVALIALEGAIGDGAEVPPELRAWAWTTLAEIAAALARPADAEPAFRAAIAADPGDAYAVNAYADFLLDQDRPAEVAALIGDDPRNDGKLLRLALAAQAVGDPAYAAHADELRARFAAGRLRGDVVSQREEARFLLAADPQAALRLAEANWVMQREPWDARLLMAAALAAGRPQAAAPVVAWIAATGIEDVTLQALAARVAGGGS